MLLAVGLTLAQHWSLYDQAKRARRSLARTPIRSITFNSARHTWHPMMICSRNRFRRVAVPGSDWSDIKQTFAGFSELGRAAG